MGTPRVAQGRGIPLKPERLQVQVLPRGPFWNAHRTSEPGLFAKQCVPLGKWCKSTAFRQLLQTVGARSSKRTVRFINGVALDECLDPERYRTRVPTSVPIAQSIERECPKLQVAGESPAGDANLRVWFNSRTRPCHGRDIGATPFTRSNFEGIAQSARADA